jgi:hypothetical protein
MQENSQNQAKPEPQKPAQPRSRPNESGIFHVEGFLRITDPNTKQVYLETRA